jgi:hypothetical protein
VTFEPADWAYLSALAARTQERLRVLPSARVLAPWTGGAAERCARAQTRLHAVPSLGVAQLREWAQPESAGSGLGWREYVSGCASSVLAVHALIAAGGRPGVSAAEGEAIDRAYLAIAASITILDSLVDAAEDRAGGDPGFTRLYEPGELTDVLPAIVREALARCSQAPFSAHHQMTLAGVVAYYTSHPGARVGEAREIARSVRAELSPTVWPALGVMGLWRAAKRVRALARDGRLNETGSATVASGQGSGLE